MKTYSTFTVSRLFKIDRTRLQEWLRLDYFVPYRKAKGIGTKAIFTRDDLYRFRLFSWLLMGGHHRQMAKSYANINFENVGSGDDQYKYAVIVTAKQAQGAFLPGSFQLLKEEPKCHFGGSDLWMMVLNLQAIKSEVDRMLEQ